MLYECHGHIMLDGVSYFDAVKRHSPAPCADAVKANLALLRRAGVGFYRDGGDKLGVTLLAKQLAGDYGIDYRTPAFALHKQGYYGEKFARAFTDMKSFAALACEAGAAGADFIKLMASDLCAFEGDGRPRGPALTKAEMREAVQIAADAGLRVMAHVNGEQNVLNALEAGIASIEHGFWPPREAAEAFLACDAVWVPTHCAIFNLVGDPRFPEACLRRIVDAQAEALVRANEAGVLIASGSDSGALGVPPESGTADEYALLSALGIDPARGNEAIKARFRALG